MKSEKTIFRVILTLCTLIILIFAVNITAHATEAELVSDGEGGFYYNLPQNENVTLDLTDKAVGFSFKVYDNGGKESYYSRYCNTNFLITAPDGCVLSVSGSGSTEDGYDILRLYDGSTNTLLGIDYSGIFTVENLYSPENLLEIRFYSDSGIESDGFEITVTVESRSGFADVTYSYGGRTEKSFIRKGTEINLPKFTSLFTLPERMLFVCWKNGDDEYAENDSFTVNADAAFTAVLEEEPIIISDGQGGFYSKIPKADTVTADISDKQKGFSLKVYDNGGPDKPYSYGCNGTLLVKAPAGYVLSVSGSVSTYSPYDYLAVFDGDTQTQLGQNIKGRVTLNDLYTTGNVLKLYFYSYYGDNFDGLDLTVTVVDPSELVTISFDAGEGSGTMEPLYALSGRSITLPECGFTLPDNTYFDYYTDGEYVYHALDAFTPNGNVTLTAFYIDKITVTYSNGKTTSVSYGRKRAKISLPTYASMFSLPYRKEFSCWTGGGNDYAEGDSFTLAENVTFTAVFNDLPILIEDNDGGLYATVPEKEDVSLDISDKSNGFTFKLYDTSKYYYYPNNLNGSLTVTAPANCVFRISGVGETEYNSDVLYIYDSDMTTLLGGDGYSGYPFEVPEVMTTGNTVKFAFITDSSSRYTGFMLDVSIIDPSTLRTLTFDGGGASGSMDSMSILSGVEFFMPDCTFITPDNMIFAGFTDGENVYQTGDSVIFTENKTLTALWAERTAVTYSYDGDELIFLVPRGAEIRLAEFTDNFTLPNRKIFSGWKESVSGNVYQAGSEFTVNQETVFDAVVEDEPVLIQDGNGSWYVNMPFKESITANLSDKGENFTFTVYDDCGKDAKYSARNDSYLTVKAPENFIIKFSGSGVTESKYWDYLVFYDGLTSSSPTIGGDAIGGAFTLPELASGSNALTIFFHSDSNTEKDGFELTLTLVPSVTFTYVFEDGSENVAVEKNKAAKLANFEDLFALPNGKEFVCWKHGDDEYAQGDEFMAGENASFTAVLADMPTVTLDGNGALLLDGSGNTVSPPFPLNKGTTITVPHARELFCIPDGKVFGGWQLGNAVYDAGSEFTVNENVTAKAIWLDPSPWDILAATLVSALPGTDLGTIVLSEDLMAGSGSDALVIPAGVTVVIDFAGHTVDGSKLAPAAENGVILCVKGTLTLTDSASGGKITGGGVRILNSGNISWDGFNENFEASVTSSYYLRDFNTNENLDGDYAETFYPTLHSALKAAAVMTTDYKDSLETLPAHDNYMFGYNDEYVKMLADAKIAENETWDISNSDRSIWFDFNGHTFEVCGTFTGGMPGVRYENGVEIPTVYPTDFHIVSTTPGVFRSNGIINVGIQPWTGDTYYFTGGEFNGSFFADGGTFYISGGHFTCNMGFNNGNDEASLTVYISGDAEFDKLEYFVYDEADFMPTFMIISENARVNDLDFSVNNANTGTKPYLILNGGYFAINPKTLLDGYVPVAPENVDHNNLSQYYVSRWAGDYTPYDDLDDWDKQHYTDYYEISHTYLEDEGFVVFANDPEEYNGQTDWTADETAYTWRISGAKPTVNASVSGTTLTYEAENAPAGSKLIAVRFDNNRLTDIKTVDSPAGSGSLEMGGSGTVYKVFLIDPKNFKPLCDNWQSN
ncbi:MAG: hypothetical protein K6D98_01835 [Clostridiales bacterium]|nr:hypothetical protein [Clostridiales bacterium]